MSPLVRLPVLPQSLRSKIEASLQENSEGFSRVDMQEDELQEFTTACSEMFSSVVEHEYYCGSYASKEQPRLQALMKSMAQSLKSVQDRIAAARSEGVSFSNLEIARQTLHNLVGSVNRCSHKGSKNCVVPHQAA